jgi:RimJ/RimL family protein N-acetyltransferase
MVSRLHEDRPVTIRAHVHPAHTASQSVARAVGMSETATLVDGEVRWQTG